MENVEKVIMENKETRVVLGLRCIVSTRESNNVDKFNLDDVGY